MGGKGRNTSTPSCWESEVSACSSMDQAILFLFYMLGSSLILSPDYLRSKIHPYLCSSNYRLYLRLDCIKEDVLLKLLLN